MRGPRPHAAAVSIVMAAFLLLTGCTVSNPSTALTILASAENRDVEPLLQEYAQDRRVRIEVTYRNPAEFVLELEATQFNHDAVWPASSIWLELGDTHARVTAARSIMRTPVVVGVRASVARRLGLTDADVRVRDLLGLIRDGALAYVMPAATQSTAGATGFLGMLQALLPGSPDSENLQQEMSDMLGGMVRTAGSAGWLGESFVSSSYNAMITYESVVIAANRRISEIGAEPMFIIYLTDGTMVADSPLGYVDANDPTKEEAFSRLQEYLLSGEVQAKLGLFGRRTATGLLTGSSDGPDWGLQDWDQIRPLSPPAPQVVRDALRAYRTDYRKPSYTIYALDFSGSMAGDGEAQLTQAMGSVLNQEPAARHFLETGRRDVTIVLPFSTEVFTGWRLVGNNPTELVDLYRAVDGLEPGGGTNIYDPLIQGLRIMAGEPNLSEYLPAIILTGDGTHTADVSFEQFVEVWEQAGLDVPVMAIMVGDADAAALEAVAQLTNGRLFDGRANLGHAIRSVKGYN